MLFVFDVPARGSWRVRAALRALVSPSPGPGAGPGLQERARMSGAEKGLGAWADPGAGGVIEGRQGSCPVATLEFVEAGGRL